MLLMKGGTEAQKCFATVFHSVENRSCPQDRITTHSGNGVHTQTGPNRPQKAPTGWGRVGGQAPKLPNGPHLYLSSGCSLFALM